MITLRLKIGRLDLELDYRRSVEDILSLKPPDRAWNQPALFSENIRHSARIKKAGA
jgi:hypothetical protein